MDINYIIEFCKGNWVNILLIAVGGCALLVYWLQERKKEIEAASLVLMQIDEIQKRIKEIQADIVDGQLNATAFYESQMIFDENYWNRYKHNFIRKMDAKSFETLNSLYDCATEILDQQQLMKNLQKNFFFVTQQAFVNLETNYIALGLQSTENFTTDMQEFISTMMKIAPQDLNLQQKDVIENVLRQIGKTNGSSDLTMFWKIYNQNVTNITTIINQNGLTPYIPDQIRRTMEKSIKQYVLLDINGCKGYCLLGKIAKRKF